VDYLICDARVPETVDHAAKTAGVALL